MRSLQISRAIVNLICVLMITACSGRNDVLPTEQETIELVEVMQADFVISSAAFEWPEVKGSCIGDTLPPKINICVQNQGTAAGVLEHIFFSLPASAALAAQARILKALPGGDWMIPGMINVEGIPGADGSAEGIVIVNNKPGVDGIVWGGIIIVNNMPAPYNGSQGIIIVNSIPGPGENAEGIIIVNGLSGINESSQVMGIIMEDVPGVEGAVWTGIIVQNILAADGSAEGIIIVNNKPAVDGNAEGIVIVNNKPAADGSAEGIVIVNNKPAADGSTEGIIIVNGIVWGGIIEDNMPGGDGIVWGGIIVQNMPAADWAFPAEMPFGIDMEAGMMAMMGEAGFGLGPTVFGRMDLNALGSASELKPGWENCFNVGADLLGITTPRGSDGSGGIETEKVGLRLWVPNSSGGVNPANSFFDVTLPPPQNYCTSTPYPSNFTFTSTPASTPIPGQQQVATPTVRTGNTPGATPTLGRVFRTNTPVGVPSISP